VSRLTYSLIRGGGALVFDAIEGITGVVESMHADIAGRSVPDAPRNAGRARGLTGAVYRTIHGITRGVRIAVGAGLTPLAWLPATNEDSQGERVLAAALNGLFGDHLQASGNPLALPLTLRHQGDALPLAGALDAYALPTVTTRIALLVHGLCMTDLQWERDGASHADSLRSQGWTPVHVAYNSGLHVSRNGRTLARALEELVARWPVPVEEIAFVAHSMGGLVVRSALYYGEGSTWRSLARRAVFLGTPHHGAPLERGGNVFETVLGALPYAASLNRLGMARSAGITDLRHGNLVDEDWQGANRFARRGDSRKSLGLPEEMKCYFAAASLSSDKNQRRLSGDGLVPVDSALGRHKDPKRNLALTKNHQWIGFGMNHFDLLYHADARAQVASWFATPQQ